MAAAALTNLARGITTTPIVATSSAPSHLIHAPRLRLMGSATSTPPPCVIRRQFRSRALHRSTPTHAIAASSV